MEVLLLVFLHILLIGFSYYEIKISKYRNKSTKHVYERETKYHISNLEREDIYYKRKYDVEISKSFKANNDKLDGEDNLYEIYKK